MTQLRQTEGVLLANFTSDNPSVKATQERIQKIELQRNALVEKFPHLSASAPGNASQPGKFDLGAEQARLVGLEAKKNQLAAQVAAVKDRFVKFGSKASEIARLDRDKHVNEESYKYANARVERAQIDAALDPTNMPNISNVQEATPAALDVTKRNKIALGIAFGSPALAIAGILLFGLIYKRPARSPSSLQAGDRAGRENADS